jgi:hypothetical protein
MSLSAWCISGLNRVDALDNLLAGDGGLIYNPFHEVLKQL